ncbi:CatB-related O-acetyltransferase [Mesobacterium sp. TK19101]|uniref:CatB-related O-acetyltransferase n=1 Tax=Mesobacterium hydrothermale TaxID=3111907 RepID=A0ABU6HG93_9RHOB|nr:CatB-related O-acetyltransferase [Mesobacterium sp. TK19101]MEC3861484.1 CatB-related O-acetyltransferase [Mesobacterium sp. TK19101]
MPAQFPAPDVRNPVILPDGTAHPGTVFLKPVIEHPRIEVGDYTYASAHHPPQDWGATLAPYLFPFSPEKLVIGKFCQIASGVQFITASANHRYDGFSSYPFAIFDGATAPGRPSMPGPGRDTMVGHDVWIGAGAMILPGAEIGNGVIIGAGSVVGGRIPAYSIVGGNPAQVLRPRFAPEIVTELQKLCWWDWPIDRILQSEAAICGGDLDALRKAAARY